MSHIVDMKVEVKSLDDLEKAALELSPDLQLFRNVKSFRGWGGSQNQCDHALRLVGDPRAYEVGVVALPIGGYTLKYDPYNRGAGLENMIGRNAENLIDHYSALITERTYQEQGFQTYREQTDENEIVVYAYKEN